MCCNVLSLCSNVSSSVELSLLFSVSVICLLLLSVCCSDVCSVVFRLVGCGCLGVGCIVSFCGDWISVWLGGIVSMLCSMVWLMRCLLFR